MRASKEDEILSMLRVADIPETCAVLADYLSGDIEVLLEEIRRAPYYQGDGLDLMRYLIKNLGGIAFRLPKTSSLRGACRRYIRKRLATEPFVSPRKLSVEMNMDERVVRKYLRMIEMEGQRSAI